MALKYQFKILEGLPPYGPPAETFSATGLGKHSEGFVVQFFWGKSDSWTGNFLPGVDGNSSLAIWLLAISGLVLLTIFVRMFRARLLRSLDYKWRCDTYLHDQHKVLQALDRLTTLELFRENIDAAHANSQRMIEVATNIH